VFVGDNDGVDHYKVQQESLDALHIASLFAHTSRSSRFSSHSFALGGRVVRNDAFAILDGTVSRRGDDGYWADLWGADLGLDSRRLLGRAGREGLHSLDIG
jgi:hypothetical protein